MTKEIASFPLFHATYSINHQGTRHICTQANNLGEAIDKIVACIKQQDGLTEEYSGEFTLTVSNKQMASWVK